MLSPALQNIDWDDVLRRVREESERRKTAYNLFMPKTVHVQINQAVGPHVIADCAADEVNGELVLKNARGAIIGKFRISAIAGWWIEGEDAGPIDPTALSPEEFRELERLMQKATRAKS